MRHRNISSSSGLPSGTAKRCGKEGRRWNAHQRVHHAFLFKIHLPRYNAVFNDTVFVVGFTTVRPWNEYTQYNAHGYFTLRETDEESRAEQNTVECRCVCLLFDLSLCGKVNPLRESTI